jgi:hypothetical protein
VFTFGRAHEIEHAVRFVGSPEKAAQLVAVINAVHDLLEGQGCEDAVLACLRTALVEGKSGTWESAGSWLRKLGAGYPATQRLWTELAAHRSATVRLRVACEVQDLAEPQRSDLLRWLRQDPSKRVRERLEGRSA